MIILGQAVLGTVFALARRCPKCTRQVVVRPSQKRETVACRNCGAKVPPKHWEEGRG